MSNNTDQANTASPFAKLDPETERAAKIFLRKVASQYEVSGAILFGNRARQSHRADSDADVAIVLRGRPEKFVPTKLAIFQRTRFVHR